MSGLVDPSAERAVVGGLVVSTSPPVALAQVRETGLVAGHFHVPEHAALFVAVANIISTGGQPHDPVLLKAALADDPRVTDPVFATESLFAEDFDAANAAAHAERLVELAARRADQEAGRLLMASASIDRRDEREERRAQAMELLMRPAVGRAPSMTPARLSADFIERSNQGAPERYPMPWDALTKRMNGGLSRKQAFVISGWSGDGKSVVFDEVMWKLSAAGLKSMAYLTEMGFEERFDRNLARIARVPYSAIDSNSYQQSERWSKRVLQATTDYAARGFSMVEARGWTADELCADITLNRWDVVGVDIVHEIEHRDERELGMIVSNIRHAAARVNAICILAVHLNDGRNTGAQRPLPVARDIRGTGMIHRGADFVLFVYRTPDEDGISTDEGVLKLDKVRKGKPGILPVDFDGEYLTYLARASFADAA